MTQMIYRTLNRYCALFWVASLLFFSTPVPLLLAEDSLAPTCKIIERACQVCMNNVCSSVGIACQPKQLVCPNDEALMKYGETIWQEQHEAILEDMERDKNSQKDGTNSSEGQ